MIPNGVPVRCADCFEYKIDCMCDEKMITNFIELNEISKNMLTAREAREMSDKANKSLIDTQYAEVKRIVEATSKRGEYHTYIELSLRADVKKLLIEEGFTIGERESHRNESHVKISW
jgi:hypothetical protein